MAADICGIILCTHSIEKKITTLNGGGEDRLKLGEDATPNHPRISKTDVQPSGVLMYFVFDLIAVVMSYGIVFT